MAHLNVALLFTICGAALAATLSRSDHPVNSAQSMTDDSSALKAAEFPMQPGPQLTDDYDGPHALVDKDMKNTYAIDIFQDAQCLTKSVSVMPTKLPACFQGKIFDTFVLTHLTEWDSKKGTGKLKLLSSGRHARPGCNVNFKKRKDQQLLISKTFDSCMPPGVQFESMKYCATENHMIIESTTPELPGSPTSHLTMVSIPCPNKQEMAQYQSLTQQAEVDEAALTEKMRAEDAERSGKGEASKLGLGYGKWFWSAEQCEGEKDLPPGAPYCYTGNKLGEVITVTVRSFDNKKKTGRVLVSGSGLAGVNCEKDFNKTAQTVTVSELGECLPETVTPQGVRYCSEQDKVLLSAQVAGLSVEVPLSKTPCPASLLALLNGGKSRASVEVTSSGALLQDSAAHEAPDEAAEKMSMMRRSPN